MEHRLEMSPEKMIEALGNEVRIRDREIERLRKLNGKIIESFRVNMMRSCQKYSHEEFDKLIASLQEKDDNND